MSVVVAVIKVTSHVLLCFALYSPCFWLQASEPYRRAFLCGDSSISHPFKEQTISLPAITFCTLVPPILSILLLEIIYQITLSHHGECWLYNEGCPFYLRCYAFVGYFLMGFIITTTTIIYLQYSIGRLRPHFLDVCSPDWSRVNCTDERGYPRYVAEDVCTTPYNSHLNAISRRSFPSGHVAITTFSSVYLIVYLWMRMIWQWCNVLKYFTTVCLVWLCVFVSVTRLTDNMHHIEDILAGLLIGVVISLAMFSQASYVQESNTETRSEREETSNNGVNKQLALPNFYISTPTRIHDSASVNKRNLSDVDLDKTEYETIPLLKHRPTHLNVRPSVSNIGGIEKPFYNQQSGS